MLAFFAFAQLVGSAFAVHLELIYALIANFVLVGGFNWH